MGLTRALLFDSLKVLICLRKKNARICDYGDVNVIINRPTKIGMFLSLKTRMPVLAEILQMELHGLTCFAFRTALIQLI